MQMFVFLMAEDPVHRRIIVDERTHYVSWLLWLFYRDECDSEAKKVASDICHGWGLKMVDYDYWAPGYHYFGRRVKWDSGANRTPAGYGISQERWENRLHSTQELKAYRAGLWDAKHSIVSGS